MPEIAFEPPSRPALSAGTRCPLTMVGVVVGIVMPVVAALLYPTYTHLMHPAWVESTRLLELPFVLSEFLVVRWALRTGMNLPAMWQSLAKDIRIAALTMLVGVYASSILISAHPLHSTAMSLITTIHVLFGFSLFHLVRSRPPIDDLRFVTMLGVGLIILAMLTALKFGFPPPASQVPGGQIEWSSALPGFISVRHFGSWTGAIAAAFMVMILYPHSAHGLAAARAFYLLSATMTIWSGTRAAILALVLTAIIVALTNRRLPAFKAIGHLSMLTGAALTIAWLALPYDDPNFHLLFDGDFANPSNLASGRLELWAATWDRWRDSPLWGWGSGSVFWEVYLGWTHTQPHNAILQFLISWGLVGAAGALWLLGRAIGAAHLATLRCPRLQPALAILYTLLLMSLLEGMLHYPRFIMLIMMMFAIILSDRRGADDLDHRRRLIVSR